MAEAIRTLAIRGAPLIGVAAAYGIALELARDPSPATLERACRVQLLAEAAGGPKLLAQGEDLKKKSGRANRSDLHTNVFNYLVRRWACAHCGGEVKSPTQVTTYEMPPE